MLTMDLVKLRLERDQPLSFLEFNYMVLQSYDFVELAKRSGCIMQMGGSDQWGNIVMGVDLGRRLANAELFGLTTPLPPPPRAPRWARRQLVRVAQRRTSFRVRLFPVLAQYRGCRRGSLPQAVHRALPLDEIAKLEKLAGAEINEAKKVLAFETTKLCHGAAAAAEAAETPSAPSSKVRVQKACRPSKWPAPKSNAAYRCSTCSCAPTLRPPRAKRAASYRARARN
jgi:tyrosyl-tRNA synthetase